MAAVIAVGAQAKAAVYTFTPTSIGPTETNTYGLDTPAFTIGIDDAAVTSGSFTYDYRYRITYIGNPPQIAFRPSAMGDVQSLQLFRALNGSINFTTGNGPLDSTSAYFTAALQFSSGGAVTAGRITYGDDAYGLDVSGSAAAFGGSFSRGSHPIDTVFGTLTRSSPSNVPEPEVLGLLGLSVACAMALRRAV